MPDELEVHPNNTHYMFGTVDTAHGGNGNALEQMAPHLFGENARTPEPYEHLPHAVEFEHDAQRVAAQHVVSNEALARTEEARVANALADAAVAAGQPEPEAPKVTSKASTTTKK